jgi:hypothetical protein
LIQIVWPVIQRLSSDARNWTSGVMSSIRPSRRIIVARNLLNTLRSREVAEVAAEITEGTGLSHRPASDAGTVSGTYRERLQLASGRFAMIDDGLGFELVPWKPSLDQHLGKHVMGTIKSSGGIEWSLGRSRGIAL